MANVKGVQTKGANNRANSAFDATKTVKGTPVAREMQGFKDKSPKEQFQAVVSQLGKVAVARGDIEAFNDFGKAMRDASFEFEGGTMFIRDDSAATQIYNMIHTTISYVDEVGAYEAADLKDGEKLVKALGAYVQCCEQALRANAQRDALKEAQIANLGAQVAALESQITTLREENDAVRAENADIRSTTVSAAAYENAKSHGKKVAAVSTAIGVGVAAVAGGLVGAAIQRGQDNKQIEALTNQTQTLTEQNEALTKQINEIIAVLNDSDYDVTSDMTMAELASTIAEHNNKQVNDVYNSILSQFEGLGLNVSSLKDENGNFNADLVDTSVGELAASLLKDVENLAYWSNTIDGMLGKIEKGTDSEGNKYYYSISDFDSLGSAWSFIDNQFAKKVDALLGQIPKTVEGFVIESENGLEPLETGEYYSLKDFNNNVESAIEFLGEQAAKYATSDAAALQAQAAALQAQVNTLQSQYDSLDANYDQLSADYLQALSDLESAQAKSADLMKENSGLKGELTALQQKYDAAAQELQNKKAELDTTKAELDQARQDITAANGKVAELEGKVAELEGKLDELNTQIGTLQGQIDTLQGEKSTLTAKLADAENRATIYESEATTQAALAEEYRKQAEQDKANADQWQQKADEAQAAADQYKSALETANSTIATYESQIAAKDARITDLEGQLETANGEKAQYQAQISDLTSQLASETARADQAEASATEWKNKYDDVYGQYLDAVEEANDLRQQLQNQNVNENAGQTSPSHPENGGNNSHVGSGDNEEDNNQNPGSETVKPDDSNNQTPGR